jgi:glycosyltransferase involved in cell wall biosynthesis
LKLKVAIVHDWLVTDAGAEKVLKAIIDIYPDADIFSLVNFLDSQQSKSILSNKHVETSFIQKLPFSKKHFRNYLPLFPKAIESFDLSKYELIISSSWAVAKGVKTTTEQLHISYCYTPIRYAWDLYDEYTSNLPEPKKTIVQKTLEYIRKFDLKSNAGVDVFIADSKFVQKRIKKTYNRDAVVIYPPVDVKEYTYYKDKEDFYITASRLVPYKKTKLIVEAFNKMPNKKLVVIGSGEDFKNIKKIAKNNILILGYQDKEVMIKYMQRAKAFVYAAIEDFGIVPIEALSCGTPVIALDDGGTHETIKHKVNGIHFKTQTTKDIIDAVEIFEQEKFDTKAISQDTQKYSTFRFKTEFQNFVEQQIYNYNNLQ